MGKKPIPGEKRVVLPNVSWLQFEQLLEEMGPEREARLTYHRGQLELMTPQEDHSRCNRLIESLILLIADTRNVAIEAIAPLLLKHPDRQCAVEVDEGYYVQHLEEVQGKTTLDLPLDPPPEVVVEIAITKSALNKMALYATLGIPEVWRYVTKGGDEVLEGNLIIYHLHQGEYEPSGTSRLFPFVSASRILEFIQHSDSMGLAKSLQVLRQWISSR